jgi:hypothetical protein
MTLHATICVTSALYSRVSLIHGIHDSRNFVQKNIRHFNTQMWLDNGNRKFSPFELA